MTAFESPGSRRPASLLYVEDCPGWAELVERLSRWWMEIRHTGCAKTLAEARERLRVSPPDVLLLDLWLPDGDGLDLAEELRRTKSAVKIIVCTVRGDDVALHQFNHLALDGMVWKGASLATSLRPAIDAVLAGRRWFPPELEAARRALRTDPVAYFKVLSDRELELLPRFGAGESDAEIAASGVLSVHTVHSHRRDVMHKLNLHRSVDLGRWAEAHGFARAPQSARAQ